MALRVFDVGDVLVYNRVLSDGERQSVEEFLATKYGMGRAVSGGDAGEGLDLDGNFVYAINIQPTAGDAPIGPIRNANFHQRQCARLLPERGLGILDFSECRLRHDANDNRIENVMKSIRHCSPGGLYDIAADNLVVGRRYKMASLAKVAATVILISSPRDRLSPITTARVRYQGAVRGSVFAYEFVATDTTLNVRLDGPAAGAAPQNDTNPILNGFTLEDLSNNASTVSVSNFSGGDIGEGLDLDGKFVYAINARGPSAGLVRDANFVDEATAGIPINSQHEIISWNNANYGASINDDRLENRDAVDSLVATPARHQHEPDESYSRPALQAATSVRG